MDPSTLGPGLGPDIAIAVLVSLVKPLLERKWTPANSLHDTIIRLTAILFGVIGFAVDYLGKHGLSNFGGLETAVATGFTTALGSILTYHLVNASWSNLSNAVTTSVATPAPKASEPATSLTVADAVTALPTA